VLYRLLDEAISISHHLSLTKLTSYTRRVLMIYNLCFIIKQHLIKILCIGSYSNNLPFLDGS